MYSGIHLPSTLPHHQHVLGDISNCWYRTRHRNSHRSLHTVCCAGQCYVDFCWFFFAMVNLQMRGTVAVLYGSYSSCVESVCLVGKFLQLKIFVDVRLQGISKIIHGLNFRGSEVPQKLPFVRCVH